ncbi:hypothetical protein O181_068496 [Austropuccinia psidii MF-1]|uniref:Uncharacterized protein n=1 Tax=Austropuccinia psidii MF-1 TaxID=1389203 RepID=A0A9Q3EUY2_9BASI|nr:hypothetical protein [Austropuccinia psidii MF-1]
MWSEMMKPYPSANGHQDLQQANRNDSGRLALSPQVLLCPPSNGHFTPQPEQSDHLANEVWRWQEVIRAWADRHHVLSPMEFKSQKPSQTKEPRIPGPSPSSQPPEDVTTREPEPEVAPTQSMEEPFAAVHESINRILLQNHYFLHMIPFVDAAHRNEMHWEFWEELNSLLAQELEAYPKGDITGIVSKFLEK